MLDLFGCFIGVHDGAIARQVIDVVRNVWAVVIAVFDFAGDRSAIENSVSYFEEPPYLSPCQVSPSPNPLPEGEGWVRAYGVRKNNLPNDIIMT